MTPRHEVDSINLVDSPAQIVADLLDSEHSRLVVFDGDSEGAVAS
jgi:putative hemolysin